jgi:hypothetical protein
MALTSFRNAIGIATRTKVQHQQGVPLVDPLEQVIQGQCRQDKQGLADEVAMPRRNSISWAAMLSAVAVALPSTISLPGT